MRMKVRLLTAQRFRFKGMGQRICGSEQGVGNGEQNTAMILTDFFAAIKERERKHADRLVNREKIRSAQNELIAIKL